ncbi:exonuclease SbcCD subunit D [Nocardioides sp. B-3]|uniref:exonuclease SbcCD subunit D n=1 Tax=Nocardioides sp. B-3 TaxID=2895565 RepID=UPI0021522804|nr:exonuclease SbcCD subunit D [Nocardioides sp. B-3]UUZ59065.1 exonuclease SbcCD subunit D C-terminal domain-containing protein [Nocardioides sp. B-3]
MLGEAMRRVRADLDKRAHTRSVVLAHAFVAGAQPSESERDISVGGVSRVPTGIFDDIDYVALGHLHGRHVLEDHIRYSGSPLAYSFGESDRVKGSWLVDLGPTGVSAAHFIEAPVPRRLVRLTGDLETLLSDPDPDRHEHDWVRVTLTDALRPARAMERLRRRFEHTLVLSFAPTGATPVQLPIASVVGRRDHEIALDFVAELRGVPATSVESDLLLEACDACCEDTDLDVPVGEA